MGNGTPKLWVRFHGRFVFVHSKSAQSLTVLAVKMDKNPYFGAAPHDVFMTIREGNVHRTPKAAPQHTPISDPPKPEFEPKYRIAANNVLPRPLSSVSPALYDGARLLWNLSEVEVNIPLTGGFEWKDKVVELADLAHLSEKSGGGRDLAPRCLDSINPECATTAIVRIRAGFGRAAHERPNDAKAAKAMVYGFVPRSNPDATPIEEGILADMVEVSMDLPDASVALSFDRKGSDEPSYVTVSGGNFLMGPDVVVTFSNLCTTSEDSSVDKEFAAFYEVLARRPDVDQGLVPKAGAPVISSPLMFRPNGDCYLAAKISV